MSIEDVRRVTSTWRYGPAVHVVRSGSEFPVPGDGALGQHFQGAVYVIDDGRADVASILAHETYAHFGVRALLGPRRWSEFMIAVSDAIRGGDPKLHRAAQTIQRVYGDLRPRLRADEVIARLVELRTDPVSGRLRIARPLAKRWAALRGRVARDVFHCRHAASIDEIEGVLLEVQALISAGRCSTVPWWGWYRAGMSKPMGAKTPPRSWQQSKDWLDAEKRRRDWLDQTTLTALAIFFVIAIPLWIVYMGWSTFDTLHWFFGH